MFIVFAIFVFVMLFMCLYFISRCLIVTRLERAEIQNHYLVTLAEIEAAARPFRPRMNQRDSAFFIINPPAYVVNTNSDPPLYSDLSDLVHQNDVRRHDNSVPPAYSDISDQIPPTNL